jgi:hypothetical protein
MEKVTQEELSVITAAVVSLTAIRQKGCEHLCVENFAPELFRKLLQVLIEEKSDKDT